MASSPADRRRAMVAREAARGIDDPRVLAALGEVPREAFVPEARRDEAYADRPLPIGDDQTISQPYIVAAMTQALGLREGDRVLEVGTGSGYQAAILARIVDRVVSIERFADLAEQARARLEEVGADAVEVHVGDGTLGWPDGAPYDAIVVTAGGPRVPPALVHQLAVGGRLVVPVGPPRQQRLVRVVRTPDGIEQEDLAAVAFVPLVGEQGWPG